MLYEVITVERNPGNPGLRYNRSLCRLRLGDFEGGWLEYEARWGDAILDDPPREFAQPLWLGECDVAGKTVLLHAEQARITSYNVCYTKLLRT